MQIQIGSPVTEITFLIFFREFQQNFNNAMNRKLKNTATLP